MVAESRSSNNSDDTYRKIPLDQLVVSDWNVRRRDIIVDVEELAQNIKIHGLQQPIVVQPKKGEKYEIIIGQRRYYAFKELRRTEIPARILAEPMGEMEALTASFSENVQRRDLAPRDKAEVCQYLFDELGSVAAVAEHLGVSDPTVRKWLGYSKVPDKLKELVEQGDISRDQAVRLWEGVPDQDKAVEIGRLIGEQKPPPKDQGRIITAAEELPDRSVETILNRAEELKTQVEIHFILPEKWARAMASATKELERDAGDIARGATIEWLERYDFFAGP